MQIEGLEAKGLLILQGLFFCACESHRVLNQCC